MGLTGKAIDGIRGHDRACPDYLGNRDCRRRRRAPWSEHRAAPGCRPRFAGRRARSAQPAVRPPAAARAGVLRSPADRSADVPSATVDLQAVRFFLGYGLIFIGQSLLSILLAAVAMFALRPELAALSLAPVPFVVLIANRYGHRSRPALQEVQQRIAELTAEAEENVSGVRVVKAFAQEERQLRRFQNSVSRLFDQAIYATRIQARYTPLISFLPNLGLAAILFVGGREVIDWDADGRTVHRLLRLPPVADLADANARLYAWRRPARFRIRRADFPDPRSRPRDADAGRGTAASRRIWTGVAGEREPDLCGFAQAGPPERRSRDRGWPHGMPW